MKLKLRITTILLLISCQFLTAQQKIINVLDNTTKQPISNVHLYLPNLEKGTITNEEGKAKIDFSLQDSLIVSCVGYATKRLVINKDTSVSTLYLTPEEIMLDEVVIYNFDLKKQVGYVLDNYKKLYDETNAKTLECTYREKFIRNDTLTRLYQVQLDWWFKQYLYIPQETLDKQLAVALKSTDYSHIKNDKNKTTQGAFLDPKNLFQFLYPNSYLSFIKYYGENIEIKKVEKNADYTKVTFNADIVIKKELSFKLTNSVIYFDNHTNAVKRIIFNDTKRSVSENVSKESKIPFKSISDNFSLDITFSNYKNKLLFSSLYVKAKGGIEYNNKRDNLQTEQSFLRTGVTKGQIKKNDRIEVEKPFFEYVTPHKQGEAKFLLTKEEQDFINQ
ncbi:carboxypeptidase-like regulatory domain-containing protein [Capnocytophaga sputigena]|uniref:carboxypeptidase-like regulatory domain-containing protein n=1 Tax=Capnocytophaga sputigena TaxID=1019 RepID=UPI00241FA1A3